MFGYKPPGNIDKTPYYVSDRSDIIPRRPGVSLTDTNYAVARFNQQAAKEGLYTVELVRSLLFRHRIEPEEGEPERDIRSDAVRLAGKKTGTPVIKGGGRLHMIAYTLKQAKEIYDSFIEKGLVASLDESTIASELRKIIDE